jgi:hypothetical protein
MSKRALLTTAIGYCIVLLLLGLIGGILAPTAAMADGTGGDPPPASPPDDPDQDPDAESSGSTALVNLLLGVWGMTL